MAWFKKQEEFKSQLTLAREHVQHALAVFDDALSDLAQAVKEAELAEQSAAAEIACATARREEAVNTTHQATVLYNKINALVSTE